MLNSDFNKRVKEGDNGHIYLKVLKEQIVDELKINEEFEIDNIVLNKKL